MSGISILRNLLLKQAVKESGQASGIMSIGDSVRKLVERRLQSYLVSAANKGIDLDKFSEAQIKYMLCLLYTSPSPRDLSTSRMPSSA